MAKLMFYLLFSWTVIDANSTYWPRMRFSDKDFLAAESTVTRIHLSEDQVPAWTLLGEEPDSILTARQNILSLFNFQSPDKDPTETELAWTQTRKRRSPPSADNSYNITVVHRTNTPHHVFVCGTHQETLCCDVNLSNQPPGCTPTDKTRKIQSDMRELALKEGEPSLLVESEQGSYLYVAYSGSKEYGGIYKFGRNKVRPRPQDKEQHYVSLVHSKRDGDPPQDRMLAFYNEKNRDPSLYGEMWIPYISQVCMSDIGGPKNTLQFTWTSQMSARLYCGDPDSKQYFSELVDVATVHAERWQNTTIYALFRNEWHMTAVCIYTVQEIDRIFTDSPFKEGSSVRKCESDSTATPLHVLKKMDKPAEMLDWIRPVPESGLLLFGHHSYTHITVDGSHFQGNSSHPVLFLALKSGAIHKAIKYQNRSFIIAEYDLFTDKTPILSILLHPSSKKLYVNTKEQLVRLDVRNCAHYGNSCRDCVLARDPYCGWNGRTCTSELGGPVQNMTHGDHSICKSDSGQASKLTDSARPGNSIKVPSKSRYFLQCPVTSHHAQYTWQHPGGSQTCSSREPQCLLLIDSMGPHQEGAYTCVSEEMGHTRVLVESQLQLGSGAGVSRSALALVLAGVLVSLVKYD
ncbi:uncharacterized protein V6R79_001622 [Siganus canaliculatus]